MHTFITSIRGCKLEDFVDECYSVSRFQMAYSKVIPPLVDKSQWPNPTHDFLHPPVLKKVAGRPKRTRYRGCSEKGNPGGVNKGKHKCPLCKGYGHHWHSCREGDPADYQAMLAERGPPKKRQKSSNAHAETSIVHVPSASSAQNAILSATMTYPPSKSCQTGKKGQDLSNTSSGSRSVTGSNQPEPLSVLMPLAAPGENSKAKAKTKTKAKAKIAPRKNTKDSAATMPLAQVKQKGNFIPVSPDSPAMSTRSKKKSLNFN